ncbi:hypothetical protein ACB098_08G177500 [Castanea mollissima]
MAVPFPLFVLAAACSGAEQDNFCQAAASPQRSKRINYESSV